MCNSRIRKAPLGRKGMAVKLEIFKIRMAAKGITNMKKLVKIQSNVINICCSRTKWKMFVRMAFTLSSILMGRELIVYGRKVKLLDDEVNRLVVILNQAWKGKASNTTVLCKTKTQKYKTGTVPKNEEQAIPEDNMEEAALSDHGSISTVEDTGGPTILIPSPPPPEKPHEDGAGVNSRAGDWPASLERPTQLSSNHLRSTTFSSLSSTVPSTAQNRNFLNMLTSAKSVLEEHDDDDDEEVIIIKKEPLPHPKGRELIFCGRKVKLLDDEVNRLVVKLNQAWKDKASNTTVLCKTKTQKYKTVTVTENEEQGIPEDNMEDAALSDHGSIFSVEETGGPTILIPSPPPPEKPLEDGDYIIMEASKEASGATHHQQINQDQQQAKQPHASSRPRPSKADVVANARPWITDLDLWQPPQEGFGLLAKPEYPKYAPQFKVQLFVDNGVASGIHYLLLVNEDTYLENPMMIYSDETVLGIPNILEAMPKGINFIRDEYDKHGVWTTMDCMEYNKLKVKLFFWLGPLITAAFQEATGNGRRLVPSELTAQLGFGVSLQTKLRASNFVVDANAPALPQRIVTGVDFYFSADLLVIDSRKLKTPNIRDDKKSIPEVECTFWLCGYMSPEYAQAGYYSVKSDVFSFGVIVLEIISGKRNTGFIVQKKP